MAERWFTLAEANSELARVAPIVERMVSNARKLRELAAREGLGASAASNGAGAAKVASELGGAAEVAACIAALQSLGVEVKDVDSGLVDFPALRGDEEVLLCWRLGEPSVEWWHSRDEGFAGRRRIDWED